jgi:hypothetical protein
VCARARARQCSESREIVLTPAVDGGGGGNNNNNNNNNNINIAFAAFQRRVLHCRKKYKKHGEESTATQLEI